MDIERIWESNFRYLIDHECGGNKSEMARRLGKAPGEVWRLVTDNEKQRRQISKDMARLIERKFSKPRGWMNVDQQLLADAVQLGRLVTDALHRHGIEFLADEEFDAIVAALLPDFIETRHVDPGRVEALAEGFSIKTSR